MKSADDEAWRNALAGYMHDEILWIGTPEQVISKLMEDIREIDWRWREEIAKYLPQIEIMSFCGPISTIRWLMDHVTIKPEHKEVADKLVTNSKEEVIHLQH